MYIYTCVCCMYIYAGLEGVALYCQIYETRLTDNYRIYYSLLKDFPDRYSWIVDCNSAPPPPPQPPANRRHWRLYFYSGSPRLDLISLT